MVSKIKGMGAIVPALTIVTFFSASISFGDIYGYKQKDGYICFPDHKSSNLTHKGRANREKGSTAMILYEPFIREAASLYGVEAPLLKALIMAESRFHKGAVSKKGALGLMQLIPGTAREVGVTNPFNPEQNILGGARYLSELLKRFNFVKELAIAAYNAGPERVEAHGGIPPIKETQAFVNRVLQYYRMFKQEELKGL